MKKTTSMKSKPKFSKKKGNSKNPTVKSPAADRDTKGATKEMPGAKADPELSQRDVKIATTPPPDDAPPEVKIGGPTPEVRPCSPAETQKGHHEVVQS
jgi:hypothetical protein